MFRPCRHDPSSGFHRNAPHASVQIELRLLSLSEYPSGFEEDDVLRSSFLRGLTLRQIAGGTSGHAVCVARSAIPLTLVRYWHDPADLPQDVRTCLDSWETLRDEGFDIRIFDDVSAARYIADRYDVREQAAFARCRHPAMRSDYLRLCFLLSEGGFYVDADDVMIGDGWRSLLVDDRLKVQPLCYDMGSGTMVASDAIWDVDLPTADRIFYVNNDPMVSPPGHPVLRRALDRATDRLLRDDPRPEIQSTTGPGNLTAVLVAHARELALAGLPSDFELLRDWDRIAEIRWDLSYRTDERNWRMMDAG